MSSQPVIVLQDKPSAIPILGEWIRVTFVFMILAAIVIPFVRSVDLFAYLYFAFTFLIIAAETARSIADLVNREFAGATLSQTHLLARQVFDYGNLVISTASPKPTRLYDVPHPVKWRAEILKITGSSTLLPNTHPSTAF